MRNEHFKVLCDEMEAFLRVPKVSYEEWAALDLDTKAALLVAAKRVELERILALATAFRDGEVLSRLSAEIDGGDGWVRKNVSAALDAYMVTRGTNAL